MHSLFWSKTLVVRTLILVLIAILVTTSLVGADEVVSVQPDTRDEQPVPNPNGQTAAQLAFYANRVPESESESRIIRENAEKQERPGGSVERAKSIGNKLISTGEECLTFDDPKDWSGPLWTRRYAGWGLQAEENEALNRRMSHLRFDSETDIASIGGQSLKVDMDKPAHGLIVSPQFSAQAGDQVEAVVHYNIGTIESQHKTQRYRQSVYLHLKPTNPSSAIYSPSPIPGFHEPGWWKITDRMTMVEDGAYQVVFEAINDSTGDSNVYFDSVVIRVNGTPRTECRFED
jgi:hypothetical protein